MHPSSASIRRVPINTYRFQFHRGFGFRAALELLPYLDKLGITDCYASPFLMASPGSSHGYDICDHRRLNPELGSDEDLEALAQGLAERHMGLLLDFVPNHMGVDPDHNPWWRDVLRQGRRSPHASFFDIDWSPLKPELRDKVLLPILGDPYGDVLERGELQLRRGEEGLELHYFDQTLPLDSRTSAEVLGRIEEMEDAPLTEWNGTAGEPASFDRLHRLLERQAWRLACWRTAADEINYRRFFEINQLAGIRVEDPEVFEATHRFVLDQIAAGRITGLRIDHIDGLYDPLAYLRRLQQAATAAGDAPLYVVVEKILSGDESLPETWPVAGTTGYDFLNDVHRLFVDGSRRRQMMRAYRRFTGEAGRFRDVVYECKRRIMETTMASELNVLAQRLNGISEKDRHTRDFTLKSLRDALREVIACFPVYRTYVDEAGANASDRAAVDTAIAEARRRSPTAEPSIYDFVRRSILPSGAPGDPEILNFACRFQQYTGPVQAKGIEDTAFYRYVPLLSLNEVGGDPERYGSTVDEFHQANLSRHRRWPATLLATATHDTKRGEDARARLAVLSELPDEWHYHLARWARFNRANRTLIGGRFAPDRNEEYLFYQTLVGLLPIRDAGAAEPIADDDPLIERLLDYMRKALREARQHTSWVNPDLAYERAVERFVRRTLVGAKAGRFLDSFLPFQSRIARLGCVNSLAQLVLKLTSPGTADVYQGCELWDLSLVDPDNRRPVDYDRRRSHLDALEPAILGGEDDDRLAATVRRLLEQPADGQIKLLLTAIGLRQRRRTPEIFLEGQYEPLAAAGSHSAHVVAFARGTASPSFLAVVPRLVASLPLAADELPLGESTWGDTVIAIPANVPVGSFRNLFTGEVVVAQPVDGRRVLRVADVLRICPVALLVAA